VKSCEWAPTREQLKPISDEANLDTINRNSQNQNAECNSVNIVLEKNAQNKIDIKYDTKYTFGNQTNSHSL